VSKGSEDRPDDGARPWPALRWITFLAVAASLGWFLAAPFVIAYLSADLLHVDWTTYANAATRFLNGEPLYSAVQLELQYRGVDVVKTGFLYPPPAVLVFVAALPFGPAPWTLLNATILGIGILAATRQRPWIGVIALVFLSISRPYLEGAQIGNVNVGLAGLVAWSWALGRRQAISVLAALAGIVKVFPGFLVAWPKPLRRSIAMTAATSAVVVLVTLPLVGIGSWLDYVAAARYLAPTCEMTISPIACSLGKPATILLAVSLVAAATIARHDLLAYGLIVAGMLVVQFEVFPHSQLFLFVLIVIAGSAVAEDFARRYRRPLATSSRIHGITSSSIDSRDVVAS